MKKSVANEKPITMFAIVNYDHTKEWAGWRRGGWITPCIECGKKGIRYKTFVNAIGVASQIAGARVIETLL